MGSAVDSNLSMSEQHLKTEIIGDTMLHSTHVNLSLKQDNDALGD